MAYALHLQFTHSAEAPAKSSKSGEDTPFVSSLVIRSSELACNRSGL